MSSLVTGNENPSLVLITQQGALAPSRLKWAPAPEALPLLRTLSHRRKYHTVTSAFTGAAIANPMTTAQTFILRVFLSGLPTHEASGAESSFDTANRPQYLMPQTHHLASLRLVIADAEPRFRPTHPHLWDSP